MSYHKNATRVYEKRETEKWCPKCQSWLDKGSFHKASRSNDGLAGNCAKCHLEIQRKRRYGLEWGEFGRMLERQNNKCAICGEADPKHLDHNHETGQVRSILCSRCNTALWVVEDEELLNNMLEYLKNA